MIKINRLILGILLIVSLVLSFSSTAFSKSKQELIQNMKSRNPAVGQLLKSGAVGETNRGYLDYVGSARPQENIVNAENQDRKDLYAIIAKDKNTTIDVVEKNMGLVKAKRAKPGTYFQNSSGVWQKK